MDNAHVLRWQQADKVLAIWILVWEFLSLVLAFSYGRFTPWHLLGGLITAVLAFAIWKHQRWVFILLALLLSCGTVGNVGRLVNGWTPHPWDLLTLLTHAAEACYSIGRLVFWTAPA